jgi:protein gp37
MGEVTKIGWTDHTFNPWIGCAHVSPGCVNCYAEALAKRMGRDAWGKNGNRIIKVESGWKEPLKWNRKAEAAGVRRRVFCGSMMDVFEDRPDLVEPRSRLYDLIALTPALDWLLLTKRPADAHRLTEVEEAWQTVPDWPLNVWLGVSVEDQRRADERIPKLLEIPVAVRFLSCEPLLGPVDLWPFLSVACDECGGKMNNASNDGPCPACRGGGREWGTAVDWVIVGGESGPGRRPMDPEWTRSIWQQCREAGVAFFGKQGSGPKSDQQYQMPAEVFATREWPDSPAAALVPEGRLL